MNDNDYCCPECSSPAVLYIGEAALLLGEREYEATAHKCEDCGCIFYVNKED